jgi:hypothetical protein
MPEMTNAWHHLPSPAGWRTPDRRAFVALASALRDLDAVAAKSALQRCSEREVTSLEAGANVLVDLAGQGWAVSVDDAGVSVAPPTGATDPATEKLRVRTQELIKRNEQLAEPSVRRFVRFMEQPRLHDGAFISIFNLMRDGRDLAHALGAVQQAALEDPSKLRNAVDPYVQVVTNARCAETGYRLIDVWRYFRHTWSNQYTSTPGRTMMLLVRDRAAKYHPVIGIAALGSPIVQLAERDDWIGWQPKVFLDSLEKNPTLRMARWITARLSIALEELYRDDLVRDGLYWPSLWDEPTDAAIERLVKESETRRREHHRYAKATDFKKTRDTNDEEAWRTRAEQDLFRSKRCRALADLLTIRLALQPHLYPKPSRAGLAGALADPKARRAITAVLRRAKADAVGTEIADLTVCGAIAPYNVVLGGKLVSMLAVSPVVVKAYRQRYGDYASEIASSMAGRPIKRRSNLVFIGTTSLYGSGASQYNRIRIPSDVLGGSAPIEYRQLGRSKSFGTSHLSSATVRSLVRLAEQSATGARVNSIFGEGVNPKLRKIRHGFDLLNWPSDILLQHGRQRIIYGISLIENLLPYLLGVEQRPDYRFRRSAMNDVSSVTIWWMKRWLTPRIQSAEILAAVSAHTLIRPVRHGARVVLPPTTSTPQEHEQLELY